MNSREENELKSGSKAPGPTRVPRRKLLAKIHIAVKDMGMPAADYRALLMGEFGVPSASNLPTEKMERLLEELVARGWRPKRGAPGPARSAAGRRRRQAFALQSRARELLAQLEDSDECRLQGLAEKICGSRDLSSCRDTEKLRRLLAALAGIRRRETGPGCTLH